MAERREVHLFCEDSGHRSLLYPLVKRMLADARSSSRKLGEPQVIAAHGGPSRLWAEFAAYAKAVQTGSRMPPDVLIVAVDSNCVGHAKRRQEIVERVPDALRSAVVCAVPEAHIERWYMIDQEAFVAVAGCPTQSLPGKCERNLYKRLLRDRIRAGGTDPVEDGIEFGPDIAAKMDLFRAQKSDPSFKQFVDDLGVKLRSLIET